MHLAGGVTRLSYYGQTMEIFARCPLLVLTWAYDALVVAPYSIHSSSPVYIKKLLVFNSQHGRRGKDGTLIFPPLLFFNTELDYRDHMFSLLVLLAMITGHYISSLLFYLLISQVTEL